MEQVEREGTSLFRLKIFVKAFNWLFVTGLSNSVAETDFEDVSSLAGNVESVGISNVQISSQLFFGVEGVFGNSVVFFSELKGSCKVGVEDLIFSVSFSVFFLYELQVADTMFVPFIFMERVIVVDTPLWPICGKVTFKIFEETFIEIVFVCTIWVRFFALQNTGEIF